MVARFSVRTTLTVILSVFTFVLVYRRDEYYNQKAREMARHTAEDEMYALKLFEKKSFLKTAENFTCHCPTLERSSLPQEVQDARHQEELFDDERASPAPPPIRILSWTAMNAGAKSHDEIWFAENGEPSMDRCYKGKNPYLDPVYERCTYTNDKKMLPESDALLFRGRRMADIAAPHDQRRGNQYWVFWEFEPPYKVWWDANLTHFDGVFNMTATYSRDSDVPNMHYLDNICIPNAKKAKQLRKVDYTWKKTQGAPIVWFASVCITQSRREKYVKELQKHIKVDIYGDCGPKKCGSNKQATWPQDKCDEYAFHSNESYKFYLAFENSLCDDYVTEKLWKTIVPPLDTVPIVFGSVDYANILPRNSYIDVRDFASPKKLAAYIKHLDANDELYNQYLRNKHSLNCRLVQRYMPWHCRLCKNLHRMEGQKKVIYDLGRFWGSRRCQSPIDFHDNRRANWDFRQ